MPARAIRQRVHRQGSGDAKEACKEYSSIISSIKSCKACRSAQKCALYARLSEAQEQSADAVRADSNADYLIHYAAVL